MRSVAIYIILLFIFCARSIHPSPIKQVYVNAPHGLFLHESPSIEGRVTAHVSHGTKLKVVGWKKGVVVIDGIKGIWFKVEFGSTTGYAFGGYLLEFPPTDRKDLAGYFRSDVPPDVATPSELTLNLVGTFRYKANLCSSMGIMTGLWSIENTELRVQVLWLKNIKANFEYSGEEISFLIEGRGKLTQFQYKKYFNHAFGCELDPKYSFVRVE